MKSPRLVVSVQQHGFTPLLLFGTGFVLGPRSHIMDRPTFRHENGKVDGKLPSMLLVIVGWAAVICV